MESILDSIKDLLSIDKDCKDFDTDIIILINSNINKLRQIGVITSKKYRITGSTDTWNEFINGEELIEMSKEYIFLKVKLSFDPPQSSYTINSIKDEIKELEFRLDVSPKTVEEPLVPEIPEEPTTDPTVEVEVFSPVDLNIITLTMGKEFYRYSIGAYETAYLTLFKNSMILVQPYMSSGMTITGITNECGSSLTDGHNENGVNWSDYYPYDILCSILRSGRITIHAE